MVLGVGLLLFGAAAAQQQPRQPGGGFGGFGGFGGGLSAMLGTSQQLQTELKMDKDQVDKVTAALAKVREEMREETAKLRDRNTTAEQRTEISKKVADANSKALEGVLKPAQLKRFRQIENQQAGMGIYAKEDVQKTLKLSDDQKEKITTIYGPQKGLRDRPARPAAALPDGRSEKRDSPQNEAKENIAKLLAPSRRRPQGPPAAFDLPRRLRWRRAVAASVASAAASAAARPAGAVRGAQNPTGLTDARRRAGGARGSRFKLEKPSPREQRTTQADARERRPRRPSVAARGRPSGRHGQPSAASNNPPQ
jgi:hypothetical protein